MALDAGDVVELDSKTCQSLKNAELGTEVKANQARLTVNEADIDALELTKAACGTAAVTGTAVVATGLAAIVSHGATVQSSTAAFGRFSVLVSKKTDTTLKFTVTEPLSAASSTHEESGSEVTVAWWARD